MAEQDESRLSRRGTRLFRAGDNFIALVAAIVPRDGRDAWRREWSSELWHFLAAHDSNDESGIHFGFALAFSLAWRAGGALPHAFWIRRNEWRLEMIAQDVAFAIRSSMRRPAFALLVVATLGLGIGVNTAMFTIVNSVLIQPLPYPNADQLVFMYGAFSKFDRAAISPADFLDYRAESGVFSSFAAQRLAGAAVVTGNGDPEQVSATEVTSNYFSTLGVAPMRGRAFAPAEEEGGGNNVVILSYGLWQRRFGGDPSIVGKSMIVDGVNRQIVGVMPPVLDRTLDVQLWTPLEFHTPQTSIRRFHFLRAIGRLRPGVSIAQAQSAMNVVAKRLEDAYPENKTWKLNMFPYRDVVVGDVRPALLVLFGAVGVVLLIACGNVASLLLARASARQGEIAIRTALGASRSRLIRQLLTESLVFAAGGGVVGLALSELLVRALRSMGTDILPRLAEVGVDMNVLIFALGLSLLTGLVFGVAPATHAVRDNLAASFASLGRGSSTRTTVRLRDALVVAQVALSLMLLVGAGLLLRSLWKLEHVPPGFDASNVLTAQLSLPAQKYSDEDARLRFWDELNVRMRALPGVRMASMTTMRPLSGGNDTYYWIDGQPPANDADRRNALINVAGDDYFQTMRIPIVSGRVFGSQERSSANAIIISHRMATRLFPNESPLGKRLVVDFGKPFTGEIIGVAGDVNVFGLDVDAASTPDVFYFSIHQAGGFGRGFMNVVLRSGGDPTTLTAPLRAAVASIDRDIPLANLATMDDVVRGTTQREQFATSLLAGFAVAALLLAVIGLYGVLSYVVAQRARELGIRIALGAARADVFALVVRRGMGIVCAGLVVGIGASLLATQLVARLLFQVDRNDPYVFALVTLALATAGLAACVIPARRATRVDPLVALRMDL